MTKTDIVSIVKQLARRIHNTIGLLDHDIVNTEPGVHVCGCGLRFGSSLTWPDDWMGDGCTE
jgi:hypothetical protein